MDGILLLGAALVGALYLWVRVFPKEEDRLAHVLLAWILLAAAPLAVWAWRWAAGLPPFYF